MPILKRWRALIEIERVVEEFQHFGKEGADDSFVVATTKCVRCSPPMK
jgi:hypothetical protein